MTERGSLTPDDPLVQRVVAELAELEASYTVLDCDPALADTAAFCEHYGYALDRSAKIKVDPEVFARMPDTEVVEGLAVDLTG
jgi:hypothetical protein